MDAHNRAILKVLAQGVGETSEVATPHLYAKRFDLLVDWVERYADGIIGDETVNNEPLLTCSSACHGSDTV